MHETGNDRIGTGQVRRRGAGQFRRPLPQPDAEERHGSEMDGSLLCRRPVRPQERRRRLHRRGPTAPLRRPNLRSAPSGEQHRLQRSAARHPRTTPR